MLSTIRSNSARDRASMQGSWCETRNAIWVTPAASSSARKGAGTEMRPLRSSFPKCVPTKVVIACCVAPTTAPRPPSPAQRPAGPPDPTGSPDHPLPMPKCPPEQGTLTG